MAKLQNFNGKFCESDYEEAILSYLEEGWNYLAGSQVSRTFFRDVLIVDDMKVFLSKTNPDLTAEDVQEIVDKVRLAGAESDFATLHKVYGWMANGIQFAPKDGLARMVQLIDFETRASTSTGL